MVRKTKAEREAAALEKFRADFRAKLIAMGGVEPDDFHGEVVERTKGLIYFATMGGSLVVNVKYSKPECVFSCFEHPELARKALDVGRYELGGRLNPFVGKWNFHGPCADSSFMGELERIIVCSQAPAVAHGT